METPVDCLTRRIVLAAAVAGFLGVGLGAFGSHGLPAALASGGLDEELIARRSDQFDVAVRYHLIHAASLLGLAGLPGGSRGARGIVAGLFVAGLVLFSGSLYLLVLTNTPWLGAVTPFGGLSWLAGWAVLAVDTWRGAAAVLPEDN